MRFQERLLLGRSLLCRARIVLQCGRIAVVGELHAGARLEGVSVDAEDRRARTDTTGYFRLVVTRRDLADPAGAVAQAREALASPTLAGVPAVAVSAATGEDKVGTRRRLVRVEQVCQT